MNERNEEFETPVSSEMADEINPSSDASTPEEEENVFKKKEKEERPEVDSSEAELPSLEEALQADLEAQLLKVKDLEDQNLRLAAEFDNFRKRSRKEKEQAYKDAKIDVIKGILPILDNLDRAIESAGAVTSDACKAMVEGVELVRKEADKCLEKLGVTEIPADQQPFDPEKHEAIQHIEDPDLGENCVAKVLMKGYETGEQVIRHSVVIVAN